MAKESAVQFLDKVYSDSEFKAEVKAMVKSGSLEEITDVAATHGYNFSTDELKEASAERPVVTQELSDEELESVAGGLIISYYDRKKFITIQF
jgi:predicted ribosomally synthesized peptide with nif11-like leader